MQIISIEDIKSAARDAYDNGTLLAQNPKAIHQNSCVYKLGDSRCGVGAAMNDESIAWILEHRLNTNNIGTLVPHMKTLAAPFKFEDDLSEITRIQQAHDTWVYALKANSNSVYASERAFLTMIDYKSQEKTHVEEDRQEISRPQVVEESRVLEDA